MIPTLPTWSPLTRTRKRYQIDGARTILEWLATFPDEGWQQRWARQLGEAILAITRIVLQTGKDVDQLTAEDLLELRSWYLRRKHGQTGPALAWLLLRGIADLGPDATMLEAVRLGQRPTNEIVDRYGSRDSAIRAVLVRYLDERRPGLDYDSFEHLAGLLVKNFWADIERHHPDLETLHLPPDVVEGWKQRLRIVVRADGVRRNRSELSYFQIWIPRRSRSSHLCWR